MEIITKRQDIFKNEIEKYNLKKKKYDFLKKLCRILSMAALVCISIFYFVFFIYIATKFLKGDTHIVFRVMMLFLIVGFVCGMFTALFEWLRFSPSKCARIWNVCEIYKQKGYSPYNIAIWFESDKIHCHIIFKNSKEKEMVYYCRIDEFFVRYENVKSPKLDLDTYTLTMPKDGKVPEYKYEE